jgi:outer membrane protein TolC
VGGIGIQWKVFDWGRVRNSVEAQRVRAQTFEHNADARIRQIGRNVQDELALLQDLDRLLENSRETVELRGDALRAARQQLDEGLILPDLYADRLAQLTSARFAYEQYRIERARAQARLLSELGRFPDRPEASGRRR